MKGDQFMESSTAAQLKTNFKRAYVNCSKEENPIMMIVKISILLGYTAFLYPYKLLKKAITEKEINVIEKLYSIFIDKIIRCLYLDRDTIRVILETVYKKDGKTVSKEKNLFHINGTNKKIVYVTKSYEFRIHKTTVMLRLKIVADLCKTFYNHYIDERDNMGMPIYLPKFRMMVFTLGFMLLNLPVILFI
jgi:hypothetical protein